MVQQVRILVRHRWTIVVWVALAFVVALLFSLFTRPEYDAVTRVALDFGNADMLGNEKMKVPDGADVSNKLETQLALVKSDSVAEEVIRKLNLVEHCVLGEKHCSQDGKHFDMLDPKSRADVLSAYHKDLHVELVPKTQILEIRFRNRDPKLAAAIVDSIANNYIDRTFRVRSESIEKASIWLNAQLADVKKDAEDAQARFTDYEEKAGIVGADETHNTVMDRLDELNRQMASVASDRIFKEARYRVALSGNPELIATVAPGSVIEVLHKQQADLRVQYAELSAKYGENYPKIVQLRSQLRDMQSSIDEEIRTIRQRLQQEYQAALQSENMLQEAMKKQKEDALQMNHSAVQYAILAKDVQASRDLYENLVGKLKEAGIEQGLRSSNISIIDKAEIPTRPVRPNIPVNLAVGLMSGLVWGIAVAFLSESLNRTIRTPEDIETQCMLPTLAIVPRLPSGRGAQGTHSRLLQARPGVLPVTLDQPTSQGSEAYRTLRTALLFSCSLTQRVICIVSGSGREGKSTTAINTAVVLAQQGSRVLLIDADMRCPTIHLELDVRMTAGLSACLMGYCTPSEAVVAVPNTSLFVLPAGARPPYTSELLSSDSMKELLRFARNEYDFIVIDTPPLLAFTDGVVVARQADATMVVVRSTSTHCQALRYVRQLLERADVQIMGVLLNDKRFDPSESDDYCDRRSYERYERATRLDA
jgi:polysaccharide biosynthesis transport protein